jgi:hypothetical protein
MNRETLIANIVADIMKRQHACTGLAVFLEAGILSDIIRKQLDKQFDAESALRQELWLRHGCPVVALYGDDGERQCHYCRLDFKRHDLADLVARVEQVRIANANAALDRFMKSSNDVRDELTEGKYRVPVSQETPALLTSGEIADIADRIHPGAYRDRVLAHLRLPGIMSDPEKKS